MSTTMALRPAPVLGPAPLPRPELPENPAALRTPGSGRQASLELDFGTPAPAAPTAPRTPGPVAQHLVQAIIEVLEDRRSPLTVQRSTSPTVLTTLVRRAAARRASPPSPHRPTIRRLRAVTTAPGLCEVAAVVVLDGRVRALALQLRLHRERWVVDALELG